LIHVAPRECRGDFIHALAADFGVRVLDNLFEFFGGGPTEFERDRQSFDFGRQWQRIDEDDVALTAIA
jgi:hypothetical protein